VLAAASARAVREASSEAFYPEFYPPTKRITSHRWGEIRRHYITWGDMREIWGVVWG
jgi:hypothetical protein